MVWVRRYKKIVKHKVKISEDLNNIDSSCTDDESEDGKSYMSHNDQDSDVSFESDNDEEIDAAEIEEEDWVEYIKRSTDEAMEKMENVKIRCWNMNQKNEMEIGDENRYITEWEMVVKSCWMEPRTQLNIQDQQINWKTKKKMGRQTSTNSSNKLRKKLKIWPKAATKSINIGSTQQKTAVDGLYSRRITQRIQKEDMKTMREREEILITYQRGNVNGVKLRDEELADITWRKWKED